MNNRRSYFVLLMIFVVGALGIYFTYFIYSIQPYQATSTNVTAQPEITLQVPNTTLANVSETKGKISGILQGPVVVNITQLP